MKLDAPKKELITYDNLLVALDNSPHSLAALDCAVEIAGAFETSVVGLHVYAAKIHDLRFRQMEGGLPVEYQQDAELEHQRDVHDTLITQGLELISDSYLDVAKRSCKAAGVTFRHVSREGRNHLELLAEMGTGGYDLTLLGIRGLGDTRHRMIGSVCRRVMLATPGDLLIACAAPETDRSGPIVACVDGSEQAFAGVVRAVALAQRLSKPLHIVSAYDPYFHHVVFDKLTGVLSREAADVFRFEEQEKLHKEIINDGLARIYQDHLEIARSVAADFGLEPITELLAGKPYDAIDKYVRRVGASLLVVGKTGIHGDAETPLGSNTEALLALAPCDICVTPARHAPPTDRIAAQSTSWTEEAQTMLERIPPHARPMARMAVQRYALREGHTVVTASLFQTAAELFHPSGPRKPTPSVALAQGTPKRPQGGAEPTLTAEAQARLERVPEGFMRTAASSHVLELAAERGLTVIDLDAVEEGLRRGREQMQAAMGGNSEAAGAAFAGLSWTPDARTQLASLKTRFLDEFTPEGLEAFARECGASTITPELVSEKAVSWGRHQHQPSFAMEWEEGARLRIERIPQPARALVVGEIEGKARAEGTRGITARFVDDLVAQWMPGRS